MPQLIARSTDQRTLIPAVIPPAVHGNKAPSLDGLSDPYPFAALMGSLTLDYVLRMKVSASLNWFNLRARRVDGGGKVIAVDALLASPVQIRERAPQPTPRT